MAGKTGSPWITPSPFSPGANEYNMSLNGFPDADGGGAGPGWDPDRRMPRTRQIDDHDYYQPENVQSGVAVGNWVPFANYLNTMRHGSYTAGPVNPEDSKGPGGQQGPPDTRDRLPQQDPNGNVRAQGGGGETLIEGPGPAGYYGQLQQEYLTGKRQ